MKMKTTRETILQLLLVPRFKSISWKNSLLSITNRASEDRNSRRVGEIRVTTTEQANEGKKEKIK